MTIQKWIQIPHCQGQKMLGACATLLALLTGCGGGQLVSPDEVAMSQSDREQAAIKKAVELNATALARVKLERVEVNQRSTK